MPVPALDISSVPAAEIATDVLVLGVSVVDDEPSLHAVSGFEYLQDTLSALGVSGHRDEFLRLPAGGSAARSIALIGLGSGEVSTDSLRYAAGSVTRQLRGADTVAFALPADSGELLLAVLEGAAIGAYTYTDYRVDSLKSTKLPVSVVTAVAPPELDLSGTGERLIARASAVAEAMTTVRDLVNASPLDLYPQTLAEEAERLAAAPDIQSSVDVRVWDELQLAEDGFGGILGVGQGSTRLPRLVRVDYSPSGAPANLAHLALVGKGITFDSGGLSLKPASSMVGMKYDMTGAATALAVVIAAARLGLPLRLTAWLCIAENMPSGSAIRPNDVLRIRGGKTVEVLNTDAEGRLVLADGLVAASEEHPDLIVDIATLTGAVSVALGTRNVGIMGDGAAVQQLIGAANRSGEQFWQLPLAGELRALLNSDIADIANVKPGNTAGGTMIAAVFLKEFIGPVSDEPSAPPIPWAHLDIAGTANNTGASFGFTGRGPTGVAVRALLTLAEELASPAATVRESAQA